MHSCICYATAFLWRISSRKRSLCLTSLPALFIPSSLFCHHILPPPHPTPHKTSGCLLSSFIYPASLPSLGSLSVYCIQKQTAPPILTLKVACGRHFTSSALHFHRPRLRKSLEHDEVEPAHTPEGREGKCWDFHGALHFCGSLLRQTLSSRAPGRTAALPSTNLHGQNAPNPLFQVSLTPCPVQRHDRIPPSPPPSLLIEVTRCLPFYHELAPRDVLPEIHTALWSWPYHPQKKTYDSEYSSTSL